MKMLGKYMQQKKENKANLFVQVNFYPNVKFPQSVVSVRKFCFRSETTNTAYLWNGYFKCTLFDDIGCTLFDNMLTVFADLRSSKNWCNNT